MKFRESKILNKALKIIASGTFAMCLILSSGVIAHAKEQTTVIENTTSAGTYTVEESGWYTITASGAAGSRYSKNTGGKGRLLKVNYYLKKDSVIEWKTIASPTGSYGRGGSAKYVTVDGTELVTAAGGGSAGYSKSGATVNGSDADGVGCGTAGRQKGTAPGSSGGSGHYGGVGYSGSVQSGVLYTLRGARGGMSYVNKLNTSTVKFISDESKAAATITSTTSHFMLQKTQFLHDINIEFNDEDYLGGLDDIEFTIKLNGNILGTTSDWCGYLNYNDEVEIINLKYDTDKYELLSTASDLKYTIKGDRTTNIKFKTKQHSLKVNVYVDEYLLSGSTYKYTSRLLNNKAEIGYDLSATVGGIANNNISSLDTLADWNTSYSLVAKKLSGYTLAYKVSNNGIISSSDTLASANFELSDNLIKDTEVTITYKENTYNLKIDAGDGTFPNGKTGNQSISALDSSGIKLVKGRTYLNNISAYTPTKYGYRVDKYVINGGTEVVYNGDGSLGTTTRFSDGKYNKTSALSVKAEWVRKNLLLDVNPDFNIYNPQRVNSFDVKITHADGTTKTIKNIGDYCDSQGTYECTYEITNIKYKDGYKFSSFTLRDDDKVLAESTKTILSQTSTSAKFKQDIDGTLWFSINTVPIHYTVEYYSNKPSAASEEISGSTATSSHVYDEAKALTANGFVLPGWTFDRWDTSPNGNGEHSYADKEVVKNLTTVDGGVVKLYAQWKKNCYFVKYVKGTTDGGGSTARTSHEFDSEVTLAKNGFTGRSYKITFDGNRPVIDGVPTIGTVQGLPATLSGSLAFNKWKVVATYNSGSYAANKNLGVKNFEKVNGKEATATAQWKNKTVSWTDPTLVGYDFGGWLRSSDAKLVNENSKTITPNTTKFTEGYQAKWIPRDDTIYKVRHWKEKVNAASTAHNSTNYELYETETFIGTSDTYITPGVKNYEGFTAPKVITTRLEADGSRVVDYYYDRWRMSLNIDAEYMKKHYNTSDNICTFDVYINGKRVADDVTEYTNDKISWGSVWDIKDIKPVPGKHYSGTNVDTENIDITATYDD